MNTKQTRHANEGVHKTLVYTAIHTNTIHKQKDKIAPQPIPSKQKYTHKRKCIQKYTHK